MFKSSFTFAQHWLVIFIPDGPRHLAFLRMIVTISHLLPCLSFWTFVVAFTSVVLELTFCPCENFTPFVVFAIILAILKTTDLITEVIQRISSTYFETAVCNEKCIRGALKGKLKQRYFRIPNAFHQVLLSNVIRKSHWLTHLQRN